MSARLFFIFCPLGFLPPLIHFWRLGVDSLGFSDQSAHFTQQRVLPRSGSFAVFSSKVTPQAAVVLR
jgi:hypothetical protein